MTLVVRVPAPTAVPATDAELLDAAERLRALVATRLPPLDRDHMDAALRRALCRAGAMPEVRRE